MWHRDTKWAKDVRKNGPDGLAQCKFATNLPFFKKKKKKKQYLGSAIKQSTIKQGMPVVNTDRKYKEKYKHIIKENHQTIKPSKKKTREERHKEQKTWEKKLVKWQ